MPLGVWVVGVALTAVFGVLVQVAAPDGSLAQFAIIGTALVGAAAPLVIGLSSIAAAVSAPARGPAAVA